MHYKPEYDPSQDHRTATYLVNVRMIGGKSLFGVVDGQFMTLKPFCKEGHRDVTGMVHASRGTGTADNRIIRPHQYTASIQILNPNQTS